MQALKLISELRLKGFSIKADGQYVDIFPADLPPELIEKLKQNKIEILKELRNEKSQSAANDDSTAHKRMTLLSLAQKLKTYYGGDNQEWCLYMEDVLKYHNFKEAVACFTNILNRLSKKYL